MATRTWQTWLSPELRGQVGTEEPRRFKAIVQQLALDVQAAEADPSPDAYHSRVLRWIPLLNK